MIEQYKVTYYSDEAGIGFASSTFIANESQIRYVTLRNIDNQNILAANDDTIQFIKNNLSSLEIVGISTALDIRETLSDKEFNNLHKKIYAFKPSFVKFRWNGETYDKDTIARIVDLSITLNYTPLIEYEHDYYKTPKIINIDAWQELLNQSRKLKMAFDPVQYIFRHKVDPVKKFFEPLYDRIGLIDVGDYLIGVSPKMIGFGSIDWKTIFKQLDINKYDGWLCFEPNLGARYNDLVGRNNVFKAAYGAFVEFLEVSCQ